jgi:hypothetical protein
VDLTKLIQRIQQRIIQNNTEIYSQNKFDTLEKEEIKNPFTRKKLDDLNTQKEKESKENSAKEKKEKEPREPNEIYQAYECFCLFHESVSAAKVPKDFKRQPYY